MQIPADGTQKTPLPHPPRLGQVGLQEEGNGAFSVPYKGKSWPQAWALWAKTPGRQSINYR